MKYSVKYTGTAPDLSAGWESLDWKNVECVEMTHFRPEGSSHRPRTRAKLQYNEWGLYGLFCVSDKYIRCVQAYFQDPVCRDSCVEFFVQPSQTKGYFNFEFNCGGTLLCSYITYWLNYDGTLRDRRILKLQEEDAKPIHIYHSLPEIIKKEIAVETEWLLGFSIPFSLFSKYIGKIENIPNQEWKANFYKCADESSHPHWASWSPVDKLNFHLPHCFGTLKFAFSQDKR